MSWFRKHCLIQLLLIAATEAALPTSFNGDEFSNNLFADLAPLLALFGEAFAQQWMSQALCWLDCFVFAMAPLGVITAMVSAIRVGGPSFMKAIVGRARENRAAAEIALMSSTSHEVCELWNGDTMVRVIGAPQVELFIFVDNYGHGAEAAPESHSIFTLETAGAENGPLQKTELGGHVLSRMLSDRIQPPDAERGALSFISAERSELRDRDSNSTMDTPIPSKKSRNSSNQSRDVNTKTRDAPNISLNLVSAKPPWELPLAAVLGLFMQLAVLAFTAVTTYRWQWRKGNFAMMPYGFPLFSIGTVLLVVGMFLCAWVVEHSTDEHTWRRKDQNHVHQNASHVPKDLNSPGNGRDMIHVMWLQREHRVGDQALKTPKEG